MPMTDGQMQSLVVVARKLREQEAPLREAGDVRGLGVGAAALLVELAGDEIRHLRAALSDIAHGNWSSPTVDSEAANVYAQIVNEMQARARSALSVQ